MPFRAPENPVEESTAVNAEDHHPTDIPHLPPSITPNSGSCLLSESLRMAVNEVNKVNNVNDDKKPDSRRRTYEAEQSAAIKLDSNNFNLRSSHPVRSASTHLYTETDGGNVCGAVSDEGLLDEKSNASALTHLDTQIDGAIDCGAVSDEGLLDEEDIGDGERDGRQDGAGDRDEFRGEPTVPWNARREIDSSRYTSSHPSTKYATSLALPLDRTIKSEVEALQHPKSHLTELAPELLTTIAELLQAGNLVDVLNFAMSSHCVHQAIQLVLSRYALWYDLQTASSSVNVWVTFCTRDDGHLAEWFILVDVVSQGVYMIESDLVAMPRKVMKGLIFWSQGGASLTGKRLVTTPPTDPRALLSVEVFADRYDCSERRLEHMDQALALARAETSRTRSRSPMDLRSAYLFPRLANGVMESRFSKTSFMIPSIPLCLRNVIVDFAGYRVETPEEKDWMVDFVCHLLPAMVSGYSAHLPPLNEPLSINEDRPSLKIRGLETVDLTLRLMIGFDHLFKRFSKLVIVKIVMEVSQIGLMPSPTLKDALEIFHPLRHNLAIALTDLDMWQEEYHYLLPDVRVRLAGFDESVWIEAELGVEFDAEGETDDGHDSAGETKCRTEMKPVKRQLRSLAL